jgi:hypothetical protein
VRELLVVWLHGAQAACVVAKRAPVDSDRAAGVERLDASCAREAVLEQRRRRRERAPSGGRALAALRHLRGAVGGPCSESFKASAERAA